MSYDKRFMKEAIRIAVENVKNGTGGPFGAVVVKGGEIIASSGNTVVPDNDPTAHAEVNAIRKACRNLDSFQLEGCEIYSSCEPCPMCLGAIYWARPKAVYYACTKEDAAEGGFDDSFIYKEIMLDGSRRFIPFVNEKEEGAGEEFELWREEKNKVKY
ncbi:nucleoside deaminase [Butyricimonas sp.]|uniref:nucleoside deaminase n=1 Tax=Butyricimonas sp. TaxID=1969738 RepID=UPI0025C19A6F|nr:nucleoside deaminase [Butyricimonas sp.]